MKATKRRTRPEMQIRNFSTEDMFLETRADGLPIIEGHAAVFNKLSVPFFGFIEKIEPGAFSRAIKEKQDVRALVDHDPSKIIGRTKNGTLELRQDKIGLVSRIKPPDTTVGRDVTESIRRGDIDQMSFGFVIRKETIERDGGPDGQDLRIIQDLDLFDVSPVTFAAYEDTDVGLRQFRSWAESHQESRAVRGRRIFDMMRLPGA